MSKGFFSLFGFSVETEFEIFKLPKRIDVVILQKEEGLNTTSGQLKVFDYFSKHNIISFKSFKDNFSESDILELVIYFSGYVNAEDAARIENTTATLIVTKMPKKVRQMPGLRELAAGKFILEMNLFSVHIVNVNEIEIEGDDAYFLAGYGDSDRLKSLMSKLAETQIVVNDQKIMDKLRELFYLRIKSFEDEKGWEKYMPQVLEADVTDIVKPFYDKGHEEGHEQGELAKALVAARRLKARGVALDIITDATGLSEEEIRKL